MIKTEYLDGDYNPVEADTAELIIQSFYDENENLLKKIEWHQAKKSGYSNDDVETRYRFLSQSLKNHYLENILGLQRAVDLLWRCHGQTNDVSQKQAILNSILNGYQKLSFAMGSFDHELMREKEDH